MMFEIKWDERALRELNRLEKEISSRIYKKVGKLKENPLSKDVKKLKGSHVDFRLRIGDYRVIFSLENSLITIWKVSHRKNIYKK